MNLMRYVILTIVGFVIGYYAGGMYNFFPFLGDMTIRATGFCSLIVCTVVTICTYIIIEKIDENNKK